MDTCDEVCHQHLCATVSVSQIVCFFEIALTSAEEGAIFQNCMYENTTSNYALNYLHKAYYTIAIRFVSKS